MPSTVMPPEQRRWQFALALLAFTLAVGAIITAALALGAADPVLAGRLVLNLNTADDLTPAGSIGDVDLRAFPDALTPPFAVEIEAANTGSESSAWGVWLRDGARTLPFLIDNRGYVLSATGDLGLEHFQFIHARRGDSRLTVEVSANGAATVRINDEVFTTFALAGAISGGTATYDTPNIQWQTLKIYTGV